VDTDVVETEDENSGRKTRPRRNPSSGALPQAKEIKRSKTVMIHTEGPTAAALGRRRTTKTELSDVATTSTAMISNAPVPPAVGKRISRSASAVTTTTTTTSSTSDVSNKKRKREDEGKVSRPKRTKK